MHWLERKGLLPRGVHTMRRIMEACVLRLARGPARLIMINIEDLWLEVVRQNTPATSRERPNWQHKLRYSLETIARKRRLLSFLSKAVRLRNKKYALKIRAKS